MEEFTTAAWPWIMMGLTIAIGAVSVNRKQRAKKRLENAQQDGKNGEKPEKVEDDYMAEGLCIGLLLGVTLGTCGVISLGLGLSLGPFVGMVIGMSIHKSAH